MTWKEHLTQFIIVIATAALWYWIGYRRGKQAQKEEDKR